MDEFAIADIDADVIEAAVDLEEDQVSFDQILFGNRVPSWTWERVSG